MKLLLENFKKFINEEADKTTSSEYRAQMIQLNKGGAGVASGVDDTERTDLLRIHKKLAAVAAGGSITTGAVATAADRLEAELDKILATKKKDKLSQAVTEGNESEPFVEPDDRGILLNAIEGYLRKVPSYGEYSQEQLSRVKVHSLKWVEGDGMWEVQVSTPDDQGGIDSWLMWYGKADEDIYYGPTEEFEIDGVKYHLAGEL